MSRATTDLLDGLHGLLAGALKSELEFAMQATRKECIDGAMQDVKVPVPPQLLDKVMKFLKDNGIDSPGRTNKGVSDLADTLGQLDLDEEAGKHPLQ